MLLASTTARALLLTLTLLLSACGWLGPTPQIRGNHPDVELMHQLKPGTSTKADVTALIGSPTAHATFDDNTWLYIGEFTQPRIGQMPAVVSQKVVVLTFNDQGVLQSVDTKGKSDALPVTVVARTTPSPGTEAGFFSQLFGNIGRFVPTGGATPGIGGGAPAPY